MDARRYGVDFQNPVASPTKTALTLTSNANVRPGIVQMELGSSATPADNAILWYLQRHTAAGTNTSKTPQPNDPADPTPQTTAGVTNTVEPTYTANQIVFHAALNQRATHFWQDNGRAIKMPATANNGIGLYAVHATFTGNIDGIVWFDE